MIGKKGMGKLEVAGIVLFIIIGFLILFQSVKFIGVGEKVGVEEACRSSVQASVFKKAVSVGPIKQTLYNSEIRVNCPKNYIEVTDDRIKSQQIGPKSKGAKQTQKYKDEGNKDQDIGKLIAKEMKNCWKNYGTIEGSLHDANVDENADESLLYGTLCFECSNIVFNLDTLKPILVYDHLDSLKIIESSETYYEYIIGQSYDSGEGTGEISIDPGSQWSVFIASKPAISRGHERFLKELTQGVLAGGLLAGLAFTVAKKVVDHANDNFASEGEIIKEVGDKGIKLGVVKKQDVEKKWLSNPDLVKVSVRFQKTRYIKDKDDDDSCRKIY